MIIRDCCAVLALFFHLQLWIYVTDHQNMQKLNDFYSILMALRYNSPANVRVIGITSKMYVQQIT